MAITKAALKKKLKAMGIKTYRGKLRKADVKRVLAVRAEEEICEVCGEDEWSGSDPDAHPFLTPGATQSVPYEWTCTWCGSLYDGEYRQVSFTLVKENNEHEDKEPRED